MERFTSTSSRGLAGWGNPSLVQSGFTLFLRVHSARNISAMGRGSYCKLYLGNTEVVNGSSQAGASFSSLLAIDHSQTQQQMQAPTHRVFRTKVLYTDQRSCPEWNEKLELHVLNPHTEILTIRVKNQLMLFCPAVGACAIPLCNVRIGEVAEQWFPLHKGGKPAGHIRLQLLLKEKDPTMASPPPVAVNESPMQRLIQQHCQQERDRRQSRQSEESIRRRQFDERERMQAELRRQRQEAEERERARVEEMAKIQAFQEQMQREEQVKVQAYLQKQMEHEEDWHAEGLAQKMGAVKVEEVPEDVTKAGNGSSYYLADDMVTESTSRRLSNSSGLKHSFTGSVEGSRHEQVAEAVVLGEVVHDALPSSDSSTDGEDRKLRSRRKEKERRKQHSRKQSRTGKDNNASSPPLFPRTPKTELKEEIPEATLSSASLADSSSLEETSSSEEERRRRRYRRRKEKKAEKKAKRKERCRRRKTKRKARRESDGYESSSSYSSSSSSSLSSSTSSADERRWRESRKHKKTKERAQSQREGKASSILRASAPPHSNSYGPDHSSFTKGPANMYNEHPPAYARAAQPQYGAGSPPGYIETLPPQPQQKRAMAEKISTAADLASILSDVASVATSIQQLTGGGNGGGGAGGLGVPFAVPDMSQFLGGQDLSALAGQDFSCLAGQDLSGVAGSDTTAQYF